MEHIVPCSIYRQYLCHHVYYIYIYIYIYIPDQSVCVSQSLQAYMIWDRSIYPVTSLLPNSPIDYKSDDLTLNPFAPNGTYMYQEIVFIYQSQLSIWFFYFLKFQVNLLSFSFKILYKNWTNVTQKLSKN